MNVIEKITEKKGSINPIFFVVELLTFVLTILIIGKAGYYLCGKVGETGFLYITIGIALLFLLIGIIESIIVEKKEQKNYELTFKRQKSKVTLTDLIKESDINEVMQYYLDFFEIGVDKYNDFQKISFVENFYDYIKKIEQKDKYTGIINFTEDFEDLFLEINFSSIYVLEKTTNRKNKYTYFENYEPSIEAIFNNYVSEDLLIENKNKLIAAALYTLVNGLFFLDYESILKEIMDNKF